LTIESSKSNSFSNPGLLVSKLPFVVVASVSCHFLEV
jgi:hypothetical protein